MVIKSFSAHLIAKMLDTNELERVMQDVIEMEHTASVAAMCVDYHALLVMAAQGPIGYSFVPEDNVAAVMKTWAIWNLTIVKGQTFLTELENKTILKFC